MPPALLARAGEAVSPDSEIASAFSIGLLVPAIILSGTAKAHVGAASERKYSRRLADTP